MHKADSPTPFFEQHIQTHAILNQKIAIVVSIFNKELTQNLLKGAQIALKQYSIKPSIYWVPGAYELPFFTQKIAKNYDAVICLGVLIDGETAHFDYISQYVTLELGQLSVRIDTPILFGVLTTLNKEQAEERACLDPINQNKGYEVALSALVLLSSIQNLNGDTHV